MRIAYGLLLLFLLVVIECRLRVEHYFFEKHLDINGDGTFDPEEIRNYACQHGGRSEHCHFSEPQVSYVHKRLDLDNNGVVTLKELQKDGDPIEGGPQQIHLSLTDDPTEMVVMWVSATRDIPSTVQYGTTSGSYSHSTNGDIYTYDVGVFGWTGWIHQVTLKQLSTNTRYYYQVGNSSLWSAEFNFMTPPTPTDAKFTRNVFAIVADMGTTIPMGWAVTDQMVADNAITPFSMVLHAGDVCYAGTGDDWEFEEIWDVYGDQMQPLAGYVPYMFAVGNHEHYYNYTAFNSRYLMPGAQSGGVQNFWYSIDYGNVHFTQMSTEHDYEVGSVQYQWLEQDLEKAVQARQLRPWIIMSGHRPMYCSDTDELGEHHPGSHFQSVIEPLMLKYKIDLYFSGHMHMYERIYPNINGTVVASGNVYNKPTAPAHVVQGTGGVFLDDTYVTPQPSWSAYRTNLWGYARMTVTQNQLSYQFYDESTSTIVDQFVINK